LLEKSTEPNLFMMRPQQADEDKKAVQSWGRTSYAMNVLRFSDGEISAICALLAAVYHLGAAGAVIGIHFLSFILLIPQEMITGIEHIALLMVCKFYKNSV